MKKENLQERLDLGITTVIFDIGAVLLDTISDIDISNGIANKIGVPKERFFKRFNRLTPQAMTGEISNEKYLSELWNMSEVKFPGLEDAMDLFESIVKYQPIENMPDIV